MDKKKDKDRADTHQIRQLSTGDRITIDLSESEAAAEFLEHVASLIRARKKITIWVE